MQRIVKEIYAGPYYCAEVISSICPKSPGRRCGSDLTSDWKQRMNDENACDHLEHLLAANFSLDDLFVSVTYDDTYLPPNYDEAQKRVQAFFKRYRTARIALGLLKAYVYVIEGEHGDHRMHHHMIVRADGNAAALVRSLWTYGHVHTETIREFGLRKLRDSPPLVLSEFIHLYGAEKGPGKYEIECFDKVAHYMSKEPRKTGRIRPGRRMYTPSIGLQKPVKVVRELGPGEKFEFPDDVVFLDAERNPNIYGTFCYSLGWVKNRTSLTNLNLKQPINTRNGGKKREKHLAILAGVW